MNEILRKDRLQIEFESQYGARRIQVAMNLPKINQNIRDHISSFHYEFTNHSELNDDEVKTQIQRRLREKTGDGQLLVYVSDGELTVDTVLDNHTEPTNILDCEALT